MQFAEPHPFPERGSPTTLNASGQQSYDGRSCRIPSSGSTADGKTCAFMVNQLHAR